MKILLNLFFTFWKIGTFSFGGGYAMLPLIEKEIVEDKNWINKREFSDIIGISQMTPGPIAINSATFVGYKITGILGSVAATIGVVFTSFVLISIATKYILKFRDSSIIESSLNGMRPALIGLIISAFISLASDSYRDLKSIIIGLSILLLSLKSSIHPILIICIAALSGILLYNF